MNFKYVHNYIGSDEATMRIYGEVGGLMGVNGIDFVNEMAWLQKCGVKKINLRINSPGGNVLDGQSIMACMRELTASGMEINTYVDYMAASIAGIIAMYGTKRYIVSNGLFMVHDPSGGSDDAKGLEVLGKIKDTLVEQLANSSGKDAKTISKMMSKETWMDADEAIEAGFFDEKFASIVKVENVSNWAKAFEISNNLLLNKKKPMDKIVNRFNLSNEATQDDVISKIDELEQTKKDAQTAKDSADAKVTELQNEVEALKKELSEKVEAEALALVENAVKEGKIKAESKDIIFENAKKDLTAVKNMLNAIPANNPVLFRNAINVSEGKDDRSAWTFNDWKKNDPQGLMEMSKNDSEKYKNLFNLSK